MIIWGLWIIAAVVLAFGIVVIRGAPYVPSHKSFAKLAFTKLYGLSAKDVLVDIGSGDGIILRLAASYGAKSIGYELNPILVIISKFLARGNSRIVVKLADFWLVDWPKETTIVYAFAVSRDVDKIARKMQEFADRAGHDVRLMTYGASLHTQEPVKVLHAHSLYIFHPLQRG